MARYTVKPRPGTQAARRAPGNGVSPGNHAPRVVERPPTRVCATCGASLEGRRRQTVYCSPTCRARACDARKGRTSHAAKA